MELSDSYSIVLVFITSLLFYLLYQNHKGRVNSPPGPYGVPLLGYWPFMRKHPFSQLAKISEKYGKIFQFNIGTKPVVVLNDWQSINEALNNQWEVFSGRPDIYAFRLRTNYKDIVGQNSTPAWKHQRRFALNTLKDMGMGRSKAEMAVLQEVEKFISHLEKYNGQSINGDNIFFTPVINVIWNIATGMTFDYGSKKMENFTRMLHENFQFVTPLNIINMFPFLRVFSQRDKTFRANNEAIKELLRECVEEHKKYFNSQNEPQDYIEAYFKQLYNNDSKSADKTQQFSEARLVGDLYNFFLAGSETSSNTLSWAILYLSLWPNIQGKVHREIDQVIGKSKLPAYSDKEILPYTFATVLEVQRYASVAPLGAAKMTKSSTKLNGYDIPSHMTVWTNMWALSRDPDLWGDPEVFRPERFLNANGKVLKPDHFIPFSIGARRCIGEQLAQMELFLFFSSLVQRFTFSLQDGHPTPTLDPIFGITIRPHPYQVLITSR